MSNTEFLAVLNAVPLPVMVVGADQRIAGQNGLMTTLLGAEMVGRHHITALRQPAVLEAVETARTKLLPQTARYLGRTGPRDVTYLVRVTPVGDQLVITFEDQSAATEIGQWRRDFVANVSHELRTPLTALMGFIETLQGPAKDDPAAQQRFLAIMGQEADRMRRLVDDLLSLSRVEDEERVRPTAMIDVAQILPSVVAGLEPLAKGADTPLRYEGPTEGMLIPGDAAQIQQIVTNLIENAIKYGAGPKGVVIRLSGPAQEAILHTNGIRIEVADSGEGIADHHIARLTERFYRVDTHRSREVGGTGLGLAIVKHIVSRHRGRLQIASELGKGACFTILLPTALR